MPTESNSFEIILKALMDDFGGPEIFSEENEPRLTKALKSIEGLFSKEKCDKEVRRHDDLQMQDVRRRPEL